MIDLSTDAGLRRAFDDISGWGEPPVVPDLEQLGAVRLATRERPSGRARMLVAVGVVLLLVAGAVLVTREDPPPAVAAAGGEWSAMAESPLAPRRYPTSLWTGDEALIWGGIGGTAFADGARYRPRTDSWEPMAPAPSGVTGGRVLAAWTGEEAVYVTSVVDPATGGSGWDYDIIAYDPAADVWRTLVQARFEQDPASDVLVPLGPGYLDGPEALVVVDDRLLLFGWVSGLNTYTWMDLEPGNEPTRPLLGTADWYGRGKVVQVAGDQVYVGLTGLVGQTTWGWGYVLDASTGLTRAVTAPPVGDAAGIEVHAAAVEDDVVLVGVATDGSGQSQRVAWRLDPATRRWTSAEPPPDGPTAAGEQGVSLVSTPLGPILLGGLDEGDGTSGGLRSEGGLRLAAANDVRNWATLPEGPIDLHRVDAAAVWTGSEVIVWGGATTATGTPDGELADGARYRLP